MEKESVKKFDLEAAFKALDEIEIPKTKGIQANRVDLKERFSHKPATETLVEDYYDVSNGEDLADAKEEREGEIAQAKLARIEKIVDLDAESPEDLLPSYVGKVIMQCPQCMTLFYKNPEDIEHSEENPDIVNLNEPCQHCGNTSGYTLIGKVDSVGEDEADKYESEEAASEEDNELSLDFEEPAEEEAQAEGSSEEDLDLDLDLETIPEETAEEEEEEKKEESLNLSKEASENETEHKSENLTLNEKVDKDLDKKLEAHSEYIDYLKKMIEQEEEALSKTDNEEVKAAIQRRIDAFNADLEAALPDALKADAAPIEEVADEEPAKPEEAIAEENQEEASAEEEEKVEEALAEKTEECKVVLGDDPDKEVFSGSKEDCEKIIEKNEDTNTAKEHGLELKEPEVEESLNNSEAQKDAEEGSELKTENESENLTLNESVESEIDSIIASWGKNESLEEASDLDKLLDSEEFETPVSEEEINAARAESAEESLEECGKPLTEDPDQDEIMAVIDSWGAGEEEAAAEGDASGALEECDKAALKEEDEEPAEKADEAEEAAEAEENPKEALPEVEFTAEEAKEVAQETAEAAIEADLPKDEEEKEEAIAEVAEEKVEAAAEEKLAAEEAPAEELPSEEHKPAEAAEAEEAEPAAKAVEPEPEPEFKEDDVDDLDECSLNKHIDEYLKEVYSNVKSYETTGCELKEGKLFVEGKISFNSGKEKSTIFEFLPAYDNGKLFFEGVNKDFSEGKAFKLNCSIDESKTLITESIGYSYKINESLVEGLK